VCLYVFVGAERDTKREETLAQVSFCQLKNNDTSVQNAVEETNRQKMKDWQRETDTDRHKQTLSETAACRDRQTQTNAVSSTCRDMQKGRDRQRQKESDSDREC